MATVFLSHAESDHDAADEVRRELSALGIEVRTWPPTGPMPAGTAFRNVEGAIERADTFVALLSPAALVSPACHRQRELATQCEWRAPGAHLPEGEAARPAAGSSYVLDIGSTPYDDEGLLRDCHWISPESDSGQADLRGAAQELAHLIGMREAAVPRARRPELAGPPVFRNREQEINRVLRNVTMTDGQHFWIVAAPPQLGKTWFLDKLAAEVDLYAAAAARPGATPPAWAKTIIDLRELPAGLRSDVRAMVGLMFGCAAPRGTGEHELTEVVRHILRQGPNWLCLIDSAELLTAQATRALRACLATLYHLVRGNRNAVHLAVVAASRSGEEWKGIRPESFEHLELTQFKVEVVTRALQDDLTELPVTEDVPLDRVRTYAALMHQLTEGLPALLVQCLRWTAQQRWFMVEQLLKPHFETLAGPYIRNVLMSGPSLFPRRNPGGANPEAVLTETLRALAPYRMITQMHIRHCAQTDPGLRNVLAEYPGESWQAEDLWLALRGTALLTRPREIWIEIYPPIRRLLFRHYYALDDRRSAAHRHAAAFLDFWTRDQSGKEQVVGMIEGLWHQAESLVSIDARDTWMEEQMTESAEMYRGQLRPSPGFSREELRDFADRAMAEDGELQAAVDAVPDLFERLTRIIRSEGTGVTP